MAVFSRLVPRLNSGIFNFNEVGAAVATVSKPCCAHQARFVGSRIQRFNALGTRLRRSFHASARCYEVSHDAAVGAYKIFRLHPDEKADPETIRTLWIEQCAALKPRAELHRDKKAEKRLKDVNHAKDVLDELFAAHGSPLPPLQELFPALQAPAEETPSQPENTSTEVMAPLHRSPPRSRSSKTTNAKSASQRQREAFAKQLQEDRERKEQDRLKAIAEERQKASERTSNPALLRTTVKDLPHDPILSANPRPLPIPLRPVLVRLVSSVPALIATGIYSWSERPSSSRGMAILRMSVKIHLWPLMACVRLLTGGGVFLHLAFIRLLERIRVVEEVRTREEQASDAELCWFTVANWLVFGSFVYLEYHVIKHWYGIIVSSLSSAA